MTNKFDRNGVAFGSNQSPRLPNYNLTRVQEALYHLASIDLIDLCNEAKVERCRATRDLRSCARYVENVLSSCGHASLCTECGQRCDVCPICRTPIPKNGDRPRLRLYYECIEAGLISKKYDDRFQDKEDGDSQTAADIERLYLLFDVSLENSLVSLICHYVTDVCMDESAVSSDPVTAILLDEVVVKDWCKSRFHNILKELKGLYNISVREMQTNISSLLRFSGKLAGLTNVVDVLDSSFKGTLSAQLHDLHFLQESILKTKQHLEVMVWCIRHQFLEDIRARFPDSDITSWRTSVRERKSAAIRRSWPDPVSSSAESTNTVGCTLFIEDALTNIEAEEGYFHEMGGEHEIASLQKDGSSSLFKSKIEGMRGCYPFENLRAAVDILFLRGSSDLVVAKQAIFLYYLFDRHWTRIDEDWRHIIDDFAATFNITRHSLLESLTFYLLDDHTDEALQEACSLLPEISGPTTHPKVAQVLLERQNPDAALMVLRWSGRDGGNPQLISLGESVTAVRVRVECGLLTEAYMYQRGLCVKVKEKKLKHGSLQHSNDLKDGSKTLSEWVETLVSEICFLCIRRNLVDRMIELPWDSVEEKYIHNCLLEFAVDNLSSTVGSLLVVFYLQRYRYTEAYQVDRKLQQAEQVFISENDVSEEVLNRMRSASHWRSGLVETSVELLPEVQQEEAKSGKLPETAISPAGDVEVPATSELTRAQEPNSTDYPVILQINGPITSSPFVCETPSKLNGFANASQFRQGTHSSTSILKGRLFTNGTRTEKPQVSASKFKFEDLRASGIRQVTPLKSTPLKELNRSLLRKSQGSSFRNHRLEEVSPIKEESGFSRGIPNQGLNSIEPPSDGPYMSRKVVPSDDQMDISWSHGAKGSADDGNVCGPRWRSEDTSDDEELQSPNLSRGRIVRRSRLSTRRG